MVLFLQNLTAGAELCLFLLQVQKWLGLVQIFWAGPKIDINFLAVPYILCHIKRFTKCNYTFGLAQKIWTHTKHFGTCRRTRQIICNFSCSDFRAFAHSWIGSHAKVCVWAKSLMPEWLTLNNSVKFIQHLYNGAQLVLRTNFKFFSAYTLQWSHVDEGIFGRLERFEILIYHILYVLIQFPWKLFFFEFGNTKVTVHKAKGHSR